MFKSFWLKTIQVLSLILLIVTITVNQPAFAQTAPSPDQSPTSETSESVERQTDQTSQEAQSTETDQTEARSSQTTAKPRTYTRPPDPYNMEAMEKYDQELYGAGR